MGSQHPSPNVKTSCNFEPQLWLEMITSRDAKSACFKGSRTSCREIILAFFGQIFWEPPDVGLAPTGVWRVPPHPPLQLEDPSLKPKPFPPRPLPPSSPHPPWLFWQCSRSPGRGGPIWCGGRGPRGGRERVLQRHLGPDPHLGVLEFWPEKITSRDGCFRPQSFGGETFLQKCRWKSKWGLLNGGLRPLSAICAQSSAIVHIRGLL